MNYDLDEVRAQIRTMRGRAQTVARRFQEFEELDKRMAGSALAMPSVDVRCDLPTGRSGRGAPVLAKAWAAPQGILFSSRIKWRPSDQLLMPAWERDAQLAAIPPQTLVNDDMLTSWLNWLRRVEPAPAVEGRKPFWRPSKPFVIRDILDLPPEAGSTWLPELWARCADHPDEAELLDRRELISRVTAGGVSRADRHSADL